MNKEKGQPLFFVSLMLVIFVGFLLLIIMPMEIKAAQQEIKIGVITSFKLSSGKSQLYAVQLAAEEINAKGGILGRKIKVLSADTESNPEKGIMALKKLLEKDKVNLLIGGVVSGIVLAQMDHLQTYKKIYMVTGASSPSIGKKVAEKYDRYKYVMRITLNAIQLCKFMVEEQLALLVNLGYKNFTILKEDAAWTRGLAGYIQGNLPKIGGNIVGVVNFDPGTQDFAPIFSKVSASKADVAITILAHTDTIALYKQYNSMLPKFRMVGANLEGMTADYWTKTGGACLSEINIGWGALLRAKITDKSIAFFDNYSKKYGAPLAVASPSYDAVYIFADAVKRVNSFESDVLIKALEETDYIGASGRFVFNKKTHDATFGSPEYCPFIVTQWQEGGKFEIIYPKEIATSRFQNPSWIK